MVYHETESAVGYDEMQLVQPNERSRPPRRITLNFTQKPARLLRQISVIVLVAVAAGVAAEAAKKRKEIKPGFNLFSKEQDIQLGKEAAAQIEQEVEIVNDRRLTQYIDEMGRRLAQYAQDSEYPFTFKVVADPNINAFALPGGPIYMHTGTIAQADNEAQVAGVMAHEIGHVVLRHSTNQASKASLFKLPAVLAGSALGKGGGMLGALGQVGLGLGLNSALLKYSRNAERDADIVGARMMAEAGYSPIEMANFFGKLAEQRGEGGPPQFLASHPNPGNRVEYVTEEIEGYRSSSEYITNTREFPPMRSRASEIKPTRQPGQGAAGGQPQAQVVAGPLQSEGVQFQPPNGWRFLHHPDGKGASVLPENGAVGQGVARGVIQDYYTEGGTNQGDAVTKLIDELKAKNPGLDVIRGQRRSMRIGGVRGESVFFEGNSPIEGQKEYIWMVAAMRPQGLFHLLMISPQDEYNDHAKTFENVVRSIDFDDKYQAPHTQTEAPPAEPTGGGDTNAPEIVSGVFAGQGYSFDPPQGWRAGRHQGTYGVTVVPENGVVGQGIARGIIVEHFDAGRMRQDEAVTRLIEDIQSKNSGVEVMPGYRRAMGFGGVNGESVFLEGPSPIRGQKEYIWLVAAETRQGLFYMLMIAPEREYGDLSPLFEDVVRSIQLQ